MNIRDITLDYLAVRKTDLKQTLTDPNNYGNKKEARKLLRMVNYMLQIIKKADRDENSNQRS